jgi:hypothetical protein
LTRLQKADVRPNIFNTTDCIGAERKRKRKWVYPPSIYNFRLWSILAPKRPLMHELGPYQIVPHRTSDNTDDDRSWPSGRLRDIIEA